MNRRPLASQKLKNGSTDLNNFYFILFAAILRLFGKNIKKPPKEPLKNLKNRNWLFCMGITTTDYFQWMAVVADLSFYSYAMHKCHSFRVVV